MARAYPAPLRSDHREGGYVPPLCGVVDTDFGEAPFHALGCIEGAGLLPLRLFVSADRVVGRRPWLPTGKGA